MKTVHAIFENGVFRPLDKVDLPEHCAVVFEPRPIDRGADAEAIESAYAILSRRYSSGEHDVAERHNEHQP